MFSVVVLVCICVMIFGVWCILVMDLVRMVVFLLRRFCV